MSVFSQISDKANKITKKAKEELVEVKDKAAEKVNEINKENKEKRYKKKYPILYNDIYEKTKNEKKEKLEQNVYNIEKDYIQKLTKPTKLDKLKQNERIRNDFIYFYDTKERYSRTNKSIINKINIYRDKNFYYHFIDINTLKYKKYNPNTGQIEEDGGTEPPQKEKTLQNSISLEELTKLITNLDNRNNLSNNNTITPIPVVEKELTIDELKAQSKSTPVAEVQTAVENNPQKEGDYEYGG